MSKEQSPIDLKDPANPVLMERLIRSFGSKKWHLSGQYWKDDGDFYMRLDSEKGRFQIEYTDHGHSEYGHCTEVSFFDGMNLVLVFRQDVTNRPKNIENHIIVAPFRDEYFDPEYGYGIHYWPDGEMGPLHNIKGLPKKIDMNATVKAFIEQVIEEKFSRPQLIRPKR